MMSWTILCVGLAFAAPADLDGLVALAVERDPEGAALIQDERAAASRALGARTPMDPQVMVGVASLGAPSDAPDPMMWMVGATQMFRGPGEAVAQAELARVGGARAEADRDRLRADLRVALWQASARVRALQVELELLDEQLSAAGALVEVGRARYAAGAGVGGMGASMAPMGGMEGMQGMGVAPPAVRAGASGGMGGMGGMGGASGGATVQVPTAMASAPAPRPQAGGAASPMAGSGLAELFVLDAQRARLAADREALLAELAGERATLVALVGEEGAAAVLAAPGQFLGSTPVDAVPERRLAAVEVERAEAALRVAELARRPDLMVAGNLNLMAEGMPESADLSLGLEVPLWGGRRRELDAARAELSAAQARQERVERDLSIAAAQARAAWTAADRRAEALEVSALPAARAAWDLSQRQYAVGQGDASSALLAWQSWVETSREATRARRDEAMRAAELARLEDR